MEKKMSSKVLAVKSIVSSMLFDANEKISSYVRDVVRVLYDAEQASVIPLSSDSKIAGDTMYSFRLDDNGIEIKAGEDSLYLLSDNSERVLVLTDKRGNGVVTFVDEGVSMLEWENEAGEGVLYLDNLGNGNVNFLLNFEEEEVTRVFDFIIHGKDGADSSEAVVDKVDFDRFRMNVLMDRYLSRIKIPESVSFGGITYSDLLNEVIDNYASLGFSFAEVIELKEFKRLVLKYEKKISVYQSEYLKRTSEAFAKIYDAVGHFSDGRSGVYIKARGGKDKNRALEKFLFETNFDESKVSDLRGMIIVVDSFKDLNEITAYISSLSSLDIVSDVSVRKGTVSLESIKNSDTGFNQYFARLNLAGGLGQIEVQVHVKDVFEMNEVGVNMSKGDLVDFGFSENQIISISPGSALKKSEDILIKGHRLYELMRSTKDSEFKEKLMALDKMLNIEAYQNFVLKNEVRAGLEDLNN
jgi:hypothetical protein